MQFKQKSKLRSMTPLVVLLLVFIIPMILAWFFYQHPNLVKQQRSNKGDLITPSFSITKLTIRNEQGQLLNNNPTTKFSLPSPTQTNGKWMIILLVPDQCDLTCAKGLYMMRQIRIAMGADQNRVERAVLTYNNSNQVEFLRQFQYKNYPGTRLLVIDPSQFQRVITQHVNQSYALNNGTIYLADPLGNIMMSYRPQANYMDIFNDLKYLLKASQIG